MSNRFLNRSLVCAAILAMPAACIEPDDATDPIDNEIGSGAQHIVGGSVNPGDPAIVVLDLGGGLCSGTLIRPNIVLTASHCVEGTIPQVSSVGFGPEFFGADYIQAEQFALHRKYNDGSSGFIANDVALIRMAQENLDVTPLPFRREPLGEEFLDASVRLVGYGNDDGEAGTGSGTKRQATLRIGQITSEHIVMQAEGLAGNACQEGSGGPTIANIGGQDTVIGVASFVVGGCGAQANYTRPDQKIDDFLDIVINAWSGPCAQDEVCNEGAECAEFVDPDCDPCGFDGFCANECENVDFDCPLGKATGETCGTRFECESRVCLIAPDDDEVSFCSSVCDPNLDVLSECEAPLTACRDGGDGNFYCQYSGPTPGTLGAACESGDDCNSGLCDGSDNICLVVCPAEGCPDGFECREAGGAQVCALPSDGGGCGCQTQKGGETVFLTLLVSLFLVSRRRRVTR